jgi:hypothetical protein
MRPARVSLAKGKVRVRDKVRARVRARFKAKANVRGRVRAKAKLRDRVRSVAKGKRPKAKPLPPHLRSNNYEPFHSGGLSDEPGPLCFQH